MITEYDCFKCNTYYKIKDANIKLKKKYQVEDKTQIGNKQNTSLIYSTFKSISSHHTDT